MVPDFLRPVNTRSLDNLADPVSVAPTPLPDLRVVGSTRMSQQNNHETLMVKLFTKGISMSEIAETLQLSYEDVSGFLTGHVGASLVRQFAEEDRETTVRNILESAQIDTVMGLLRQRDFGENGQTKISAGKELTAMLNSMGPRKGLKGMTPEQAYAEAQKRMAKLQSNQQS